jgi:hypothetical protein
MGSEDRYGIRYQALEGIRHHISTGKASGPKPDEPATAIWAAGGICAAHLHKEFEVHILALGCCAPDLLIAPPGLEIDSLCKEHKGSQHNNLSYRADFLQS